MMAESPMRVKATSNTQLIYMFLFPNAEFAAFDITYFWILQYDMYNYENYTFDNIHQIAKIWLGTCNCQS